MDKKMIWNHQHGFPKSCLTNLTNFYKEITRLVDKAGAVDVYVDFTRAFGTVSEDTYRETDEVWAE